MLNVTMTSHNRRGGQVFSPTTGRGKTVLWDSVLLDT
jgi:hypothetical protein